MPSYFFLLQYNWIEPLFKNNNNFSMCCCVFYSILLAQCVPVILQTKNVYLYDCDCDCMILEETGSLCALHSEFIHSLLHSQNQIHVVFL